MVANSDLFKKLKWVYFICVLFMVVCPVQLLAQPTPVGKLTGKVTDGSTNNSLTGVSVTPKGTRNGTSSITDGTYILSLKPGTYSIVYSYTGYKSKEVADVVIKANETTYLDMILELAGALQSVTVTTSIRRETQSSVYNAQRRSSAVSDGISAESIRRTPDNDGAQILKRVTGVSIQENRFVVVRGLGEQYNQTMINGVPVTSTETNRNAFAFDLIPAAAIDNITINKTATPDMPGNFAGGIVQVNTRDFPASDFFSISVQGGFSDETIGKDFYGDKRNKAQVLAFGGNIRDLPDGFPTPRSRTPFTDLNTQEKYRYLRLLKNNLAPILHGQSGLNENIQLGYGKTIKLSNNTQFGIIAALNQRKTELVQDEITAKNPRFLSGGPGVSPDTSIDQLNYYSENVRYNYTSNLGGILNLAYRFGNNKISLKNLYTRTLNNYTITRPTVFIDAYDLTDTQKIVGISYFTEEKVILNSILGGEHRTGKNNETKIDWNIGLTVNTTQQPDTRNFLLTTDTANTVKPDERIYSGDKNQNLVQSLERNSRLWSDGKDMTYAGAFNVTSPFTLFGEKHLLKTGFLYQNRRRQVTGTVIPIQGLNNTIDSLLAPSQYRPGGASTVTSTAEFVSSSGNYNAGSSLLAAYESLENKFGKYVRVIWGLRIENYQQNVNLYRSQYFDNFNDPSLTNYQIASRNEFNFLPSVNLVYSPWPTVNVRAGYSNTVIRPELRDIAEFPRFDYQTLQLATGNRELRSTSIKNYDVKLEWFPSAGEIVSVAAFYKDMLDPIEYGRPSSGVGDVFRIPINVGNAYVKGVEAEFRKKLDFFSFAPWLENVTLFGNGALMDSKVERQLINSFLFDSISEHKLTGQADYIVNAGINILAFKKTFDFTLSYNRTGDYITEIGRFETIALPNGSAAQQIPNFFLKSRDILDLSVSQSFYKGKARIKLNVTNILKTKVIIYQDTNGNGKFDGAIMIAKTGGNPLKYVSGVDATASDLNAQRAYSFTLSYTF